MTKSETAPDEAQNRVEFAALELKLFSQLRKGGFDPKSIYDIGSAAGSWSYNVAQIFPEARFELFEPLSDLELYQNLLVKWLNEYPSFRLHEIGLAADNSEVSMMICHDGFSSSLIDLGTHEAVAGRRMVPVRRLDDYVQEIGLAPPDLVKMDTQGTEGEIIAGGKEVLSKAQLVQIECWMERGYGLRTPLIGEIIAQMSELGFYLAEFGDVYYEKSSHRLMHVDAFFVQYKLAKVLTRNPDGELWVL